MLGIIDVRDSRLTMLTMLTEQQRWQLIADNAATIRSICRVKRQRHMAYPAVRRISLDELTSDVQLFIFDRLAGYDESRSKPEHYIKSLAAYGASGVIYQAKCGGYPAELQCDDGIISSVVDGNAIDHNAPEGAQHKTAHIGADSVYMYREAYAMLSPRRRTILQWTLQGLSQQQISERLGIDRSRVAHEIAAAKQELRSLCGESNE